MQFIPAHPNYPTQMKALVEQTQCLPLSALIGFFFTYKDLNLACYQATDGS
jgi:hypothetical protein